VSHMRIGKVETTGSVSSFSYRLIQFQKYVTLEPCLTLPQKCACFTVNSYISANMMDSSFEGSHCMIK
jgi:hypothetical protein